MLTKSTQTLVPCSAFYSSYKILAISLDMRAERKRKVRSGRFIRAQECRSRFYIIRWCLVRLLCWHDWRVCSTFVMSTKAKLLLQPVWKPQERDRPRCYNKELKLHESVKPTSPAIFWENVEFFPLLFNWALCVGFNWLCNTWSLVIEIHIFSCIWPSGSQSGIKLWSLSVSTLSWSSMKLNQQNFS